MIETTQLIMIGTLHYDPKGRERTTKMLERFQPTVITVEGNIHQEQWTKAGKLAIEKETRRMLAKRGLTPDEVMLLDRWEEQTFHYECHAARSYCQERRIPFFLIDLFDSQEQVAWGKQLTKFAREASLDKIRYCSNPSNAGGSQKAVDEDYRRVYMSLNFYGTIISEDDPDVGRRDVYMETRIREIFRRYPGAKIVHIGGTKHIFDDPWPWRRTLFSRLKDLNPERHLLVEADEQPKSHSY